MKNFLKYLDIYTAFLVVGICLSLVLLSGCVSVPVDNRPKTDTEVLSEGLNQALSTIVIFGGK